jgi:hypothetical protein
MGSDIKCFKFEEQQLFEKNPGPAFRYDLYENARIEAGSNSSKSITKKIKVMKISAIRYYEEEDKYSEPKNFWWNPETNIIYDYELRDVPLAKIKVDPSSLLPIKYNEHYIIGQIIQGINPLN